MQPELEIIRHGKGEQPVPNPGTPACEACGRPLRIIMRKIRPHRTKPGLEMYEVFAKCAKRLRPHRYVAWEEHDPRSGKPLPAPRFVAEG